MAGLVCVSFLSCAVCQAVHSRKPTILYFVSGTPTAERQYSVELYRAQNHAPSLVRELVRGDPRRLAPYGGGVSLIADDLAGHIVVVYPNDATGPNGPQVSVIHEDRPEFEDHLAVTARRNGGPTIISSKQGPGLLLDAVVAYRKSEVHIVALDSPAKIGRIRPGRLQDYSGVIYPGIGFAPSVQQLEPSLSAGIVVRPNGVFMAYYQGDDPIGKPTGFVQLAPPPSGIGAAPFGPGPVLIAASANYFVFDVPKPSTNPGYVDGEDWGPATAFSLDRRTGKWRTVVLFTPAAEPTARLFGDWLTNPVAVPRKDNNEHPGAENEANEMGDCGAAHQSLVFPDMQEAYAYADDFYLPGIIQFTNLADGRSFILKTGQEDSQVIAVDSAKRAVIYRVNDEIFRADFKGDSLGPSTSVMKGCDVQNIHWAFWGPQ